MIARARGSLRKSIFLFAAAVLMAVLGCDPGTEGTKGGEGGESGESGSPDDTIRRRRKPPTGPGGTGGSGGNQPGTGGTGGEGGAETPRASCEWLCDEVEAGCDASLEIPDCVQLCEDDRTLAGCLEAFCAPEASSCHPSLLCEEACANTYLGCAIQFKYEWDPLTQEQCAIVCEMGGLGHAQATCLADLVCGNDSVENSVLVSDCLEASGTGGRGGGGPDDPDCADWGMDTCFDGHSSYCTNLDWDQANCGACGFDCKIISQGAICDGGECW